MAIYQLGDDPEYAPRIAPTAWVADSATVLGRVQMGALRGAYSGSSPSW